MGRFSSSTLPSDLVKQLPKIISYAYSIWIFESLDLLSFCGCKGCKQKLSQQKEQMLHWALANTLIFLCALALGRDKNVSNYANIWSYIKLVLSLASNSIPLINLIVLIRKNKYLAKSVLILTSTITLCTYWGELTSQWMMAFINHYLFFKELLVLWNVSGYKTLITLIILYLWKFLNGVYMFFRWVMVSICILFSLWRQKLLYHFDFSSSLKLDLWICNCVADFWLQKAIHCWLMVQ